jgi:hypothetical protein
VVRATDTQALEACVDDLVKRLEEEGCAPVRDEI